MYFNWGASKTEVSKTKTAQQIATSSGYCWLNSCEKSKPWNVSQLTNQTEVADCPLALAHSGGPGRREGGEWSNQNTREREWDSATSITRISMTSCFTEILLSRHMGCCCGSKMRPRWWAGLAWPNLATHRGEQAAHSLSAETVSMVPSSHMDRDWSSTETLSASIPESILWFESLNVKQTEKLSLDVAWLYKKQTVINLVSLYCKSLYWFPPACSSVSSLSQLLSCKQVAVLRHKLHCLFIAVLTGLMCWDKWFTTRNKIVE